MALNKPIIQTNKQTKGCIGDSSTFGMKLQNSCFDPYCLFGLAAK